MVHKEENLNEFTEILKGSIRKNLKKFIRNNELIGQKGRDKIKITIPDIVLPKYQRGRQDDEYDPSDSDGTDGWGSPGSGQKKQPRGVGKGAGNIGQQTRPGPGQSGQRGRGEKEAGTGSSENIFEEDISLEELVSLVKEELHLPNLQKKESEKMITIEETKFKGLRRKGPWGLLRFKPTFFEALKRQVASGEYDFENPIVLPQDDDFRFLSWTTIQKPQTSAVLIYMMDVSGSMDERHREIARLVAFWTDALLRSEYKGLESVYIIHDWDAEEVSEDQFWKVNRWGGTRFKSAYSLAEKIIDTRFNPAKWNIYLLHYTDGYDYGDHSWNTGETKYSVLERLAAKTNNFFLAQINYSWWQDNPFYSRYYRNFSWQGPFLKELHEWTEKKGLEDYVRTALLHTKDDVLDSITTFFGKHKGGKEAPESYNAG